MTRLPIVPALLAASLLVLAGCAPGGSGGSGGAGGDGGSGGDSGGGDAAAACASVADGGYELFVDPRLTVEPTQDVYSLESGDSIAFTDTDPVDEPSYSYTSYYIDNGSAFLNGGTIFVGAEDTNAFTLDGPQAPSGIDGGPYPGIIEIEATTTSTTVLARLCVQFAASE